MVAACGPTTARDPLMLAAHRKARRDSPANDNTEVLSVAAEPVALSEQLRPLAAALAFVSEGRYREATPDEPATILIVQPGSGAEIRELRRRYPDRAIVVWDRAAGAASTTVADNLDAGADVYVAGANVTVLVCHIDALQRRTSVSPG